MPRSHQNFRPVPAVKLLDVVPTTFHTITIGDADGCVGTTPHARSHQTFRPVPHVKMVEMMLENRCWSITFHIITVEDVDGWCHNWPV